MRFNKAKFFIMKIGLKTRSRQTKKTGYRSSFHVSIFTDRWIHVMLKSTNVRVRKEHNYYRTIESRNNPLPKIQI